MTRTKSVLVICLLIGVIGLVLAGLAWVLPVNKVSHWVVATDASDLASGTAASILDTPRCLKYKQEVMFYAPGSASSIQVCNLIDKAKRKAIEDHCAIY